LMVSLISRLLDPAPAQRPNHSAQRTTAYVSHRVANCIYSLRGHIEKCAVVRCGRYKPLKILDRDHSELFGTMWSSLLLALLVHPHPPPFALPIRFAVRPLALPSDALHGGHYPVLF
jgi:hypothetical protein